MKLYISTLVLFSSLLTGCEGDDNDDSDKGTGYLSGKWTTECYQSNTEYEKRNLQRKDNTVFIKTKVYSDDKCANHLTTDSEEWSAEFQVPSFDKGKVILPVNLSLNSVKRAYHKQVLVDQANDEKYWGYQNWKLNGEFDYTGKKKTADSPDGNVLNKGNKLYTFYSDHNDIVSEGKSTEDKDGNSIEKRHEVESEYKFKKVEKK